MTTTTKAVSRQVRRAEQRAKIKTTMTKVEQRAYFRMPKALKREVYFTTLAMIASGH